MAVSGIVVPCCQQGFEMRELRRYMVGTRHLESGTEQLHDFSYMHCYMPAYDSSKAYDYSLAPFGKNRLYMNRWIESSESAVCNCPCRSPWGLQAGRKRTNHVFFH